MTKERFEVSTEGMRAIHAGRPLWQLVKELVANAWDEEGVTVCDVSLTPIYTSMETIVSVTDDGPGFSDIADAWTLLGHTAKRGRPDVRGRFNVGEKEIIAISTSARIETAGHVIEFPKAGGRRVSRNGHRDGTLVHVVVPSRRRKHQGLDDDVRETEEMLTMFRAPPSIEYRVNGLRVDEPDPIEVTVEATLPTVIQDSPTEPLRNTKRKTKVVIAEPRDGNSWLYEMGIPVQKINCSYDVDVQQKVPLSQNRDSVRDSYLKDIYSVVLEAMAQDISTEEIGEAWVQQGVENPRTPPETVEAVLDTKLGDDAVLWSSDAQANERAIEDGKVVVHPRTLGTEERERYKGVGLQGAAEAYPAEPKGVDLIVPNKAMLEVAAYAEWLADRLEVTHTLVSMFHKADDSVLASYGNGTLHFNVQNLGEEWFEDCPHPRHLDLLLHELAHEGESTLPHHGEYTHRLTALAAKAVHLALEVGEKGWFRP
jgi:hypothetical protein